MNTIFKLFIITGIIALALSSCEDEFGPRKESTPVIESASVAAQNIVFGDSVTVMARITDPATSLASLVYELESESQVLASGEIPLSGDDMEVSFSVFVPLINNQQNNADLQVNLTARNMLKGTSTYTITGITGTRPVYNQLFLVTDVGSVAVLKPNPGNNNVFENEELTMDSYFTFRIAEKIHPDNSIDFSGDVFGNIDGTISMIDVTGESAFTFTPETDYTNKFVFDTQSFNVTTTGSKLTENDLSISNFEAVDIFGESFHTLKRTFEQGQTYPLFGRLADPINIYNPDFFERSADNLVTFIGETGEYTLYYNPVRKNIIIGVDNPSYPDYLVVCGWGLGYPTNVTSGEIASVYPGHQRTHTNWGFGHIMDYVLMRRTGDNIYQGTFFTPAENDHYAGFKPFENTEWANEKKAGDFTFTGEQIITGDGDWTIPNDEDDPVIDTQLYRFTIDLNEHTVNIEKVTL